MVTAQNSWFLRGGHYTLNSLAGVFCFYGTYGDANGVVSFRLVLSAT